MLKKKNRLTTNEFKKVFKKGKKTFSPFFLVTVLEAENQKKISVAISKKVEKTSVARSESRRKVYKILQENFSEITENVNTTILITRKINDIKKTEIKKELFQILKKTKLLK